MEHSLNETDLQMVRREIGRSRRGGSRWAAKVPTDICWVSGPATQCRHPSSLSARWEAKKHLPRPSLCRFVHSISQQDVTIPKFYSGNNFSKKLGHISEERNTTLDKASSAVESQCRAAEHRGFLPTSASAAARNYLGSRLTWKGSIPVVLKVAHTSIIQYDCVHHTHHIKSKKTNLVVYSFSFWCSSANHS